MSTSTDKTDDEIIEILATEVMGWVKEFCGTDPELYGAPAYCWKTPDGKGPWGYCQDFVFARQWNPLKNLDDCFQLQEKASEDRFLWSQVLFHLPFPSYGLPVSLVVSHALRASAEVRARAIYKAVLTRKRYREVSNESAAR